MTARLDDGREVHFTPADIADNRGRARLAIASATTLFQAQGLICEQAFALITERFDPHDAYVVSSRARGNTHLHLDRRCLDRSLRAAEPVQVGVNGTTVGGEGQDSRLGYLARQLAREARNTTTLDVARAAAPRAQEAEAERRLRTIVLERDDA